MRKLEEFSPAEKRQIEKIVKKKIEKECSKIYSILKYKYLNIMLSDHYDKLELSPLEKYVLIDVMKSKQYINIEMRKFIVYNNILDNIILRIKKVATRRKLRNYQK